MPIHHPPPTPRRRGFSSLALLSAGALLFTSAAPGVLVLAKGAKAALAQAARRPSGPFTQRPAKAFLGARPGRDPQGRGGVWSAARRAEVGDSAEMEGLGASVGEYQGTAPHTLAVAAEPGAAFPWEGDADGVNTGNGNKLTSLHLFSWRVRGGASLDFTLYHNSQTNYSDELGAGWTWTYDCYINNLTSNPVVHWGDGTSVPYAASTSGGGTVSSGGGSGTTTYAPPAGFHDALSQNADGSWTLIRKDGTTFFFNSTGYLARIADRNGNSFTITLNASKYVTHITDPTGRKIDVGLSASNKFTSVNDPDGRTWTFSLDGNGDLASVTWPDLGDGHTYSDAFAYNSAHAITTHTDRRGKAWAYAYNADGSLASETDPLGHATTFGYGASATTVTDPLGHVETDNYASGVEASHVDASGFSTSYTARNANYDPTGWTDARGKAWTATYDALGNRLSVTDPLSHTTSTTYNGYAEPLVVTDALGHATTSAYDVYGNLLTVTNALGKTVLTDVNDAYGQTTSATDALGKVTTLNYSANGDLLGTHDPTGVYTWRTVDGRGNTTADVDGASDVTYHDVDAWDRTEDAVPPNTGGGAYTATYYAYLPTGETSSVTDELGHATTSGYDDAGRLTSVTNARGDAESYGYDAASRRTTVTNGRGKVRTYAFTDRGDVSSLTMPDGAVESWSYDGGGNATAYVNPLSQTILYTFDDAGRETLVDYPTGTDTSFVYDAASRRTSMTDATGSTTWAYDASNRETAFAAPQGSQTSGYDDAGHRTSLTGAGISRSWTYDDAGRPLTLANESSETTAFGYDGAGRLSTTTLANGQVTTLGYDDRNRQTSVVHQASASGSTISSESYVYDRAGNLTSKTVDGTTTGYGYDAANQLTSEAYAGYSASYAYDANGNRTGKTLNGTTQTYAIDDGDKLTAVTQGGATVKSYGYDAAGRTTSVASSAGTTTLAYDYEGRVTSISGPGVSNSFTYNGLDTRVGKVDSGGTSAYRRDGADVTDDVLSDGSAVYTPGVSQRRSGATTYDLHDQLGTASKQTNASASTTATRTYDAFGMLLASTGTPQGPFGFAATGGYQEDGDSGLKLLGHRYFDPSTGRFLTRDPIKDGRNWYAYCDNNPIKRMDPTGLMILLLLYMSEYASGAFPPGPNHGMPPPVEPPYNPIPTTSTGGGGEEPMPSEPLPAGPQSGDPGEGDIYNQLKGPDWPSYGPPNGTYVGPLPPPGEYWPSGRPGVGPCRQINAVGDDVGSCSQYNPPGSAGYGNGY